MIIKLKKNTIYINEFKLKCAFGKAGIRTKVKEGDKITPKGIFQIGSLHYRSDKINKLQSKLKKKKIKKNMGWCDDPKSKYYNRLIKINNNTKFSFERLHRADNKYDMMIPIYYNYIKPVKNRGSAIFLHLTKNYEKTDGCITLKKKDFLVMINLINKKTRIKIY